MMSRDQNTQIGKLVVLLLLIFMRERTTIINEGRKMKSSSNVYITVHHTINAPSMDQTQSMLFSIRYSTILSFVS